MTTRFNRAILFTVLGMVSLVFIGCPALKKETKPTDNSKGAAAVTSAEGTSAPSGETIGTEWTTLGEVKEAYFDFDKTDLGSGALGTLKGNTAVLKRIPRSVQVIVEGYCDERGTIEYNVALGQRRANAVKDYYAHAGIDRSRIQTISYGKERPTCSDSTEECWARNRRGVTRVRNSEPVAVNPE